MDSSKHLALQLQLPETRPAALKIIAKALNSSKGSTIEAAAELGVNYRTFARWVEKQPDLAELVAEARVKHGREAAARESPATGGVKRR